MPPIFFIIFAVVVLFAVVLVIVGMRSPEAQDPLHSRLAEFGSRDTPGTASLPGTTSAAV